MNRVLFSLTVTVTSVWAQGTGSLKGVITAPDGLPVPLASVEAKNPTTGVANSAMSSATGEYSITKLPAGSYDVTVNSIRYLAPFDKKGLSVLGDTRLDVKLTYVVMG